MRELGRHLRSLPGWARALAFAALVALAYLAGLASGGGRRPQPVVTRVVDGDTIRVRFGSEEQPVRYIGMDTPERDKCYFNQATAKNRDLVGGKQIRLEKDVSSTDRYGRLLRYVYVGEIFVNAELVRLGYANAYTDPPDVKYADLFVKLQREARTANRGLWDPTVCAAPEGGPPR